MIRTTAKDLLNRLQKTGTIRNWDRYELDKLSAYRHVTPVYANWEVVNGEQIVECRVVRTIALRDYLKVIQKDILDVEFDVESLIIGAGRSTTRFYYLLGVYPTEDQVRYYQENDLVLFTYTDTLKHRIKVNG